MAVRRAPATSVALLLGLGIPLASWAGPPACYEGDCDGVPDIVDNCWTIPNPSQCDADMDGCDCDLNNSGACDTADIPPMKAALAANNPIGDIDCSGATDTSDIPLFKALLANPATPGPSGYACAGTIPCP